MAPGSLQSILLVVDGIEAATVDLALSIIAAGGAYFTGLPLSRGLAVELAASGRAVGADRR